VNTRVRSVRLPDSLWSRLQTFASANDVSVSTVILMALNAYIDGGAKWEKR
jgi:predicted transcriptional regulator